MNSAHKHCGLREHANQDSSLRTQEYRHREERSDVAISAVSSKNEIASLRSQ